jgi:hypothetical protein
MTEHFVRTPVHLTDLVVSSLAVWASMATHRQQLVSGRLAFAKARGAFVYTEATMLGWPLTLFFRG